MSNKSLRLYSGWHLTPMTSVKRTDDITATDIFAVSRRFEVLYIVMTVVEEEKSPPLL